MKEEYAAFKCSGCNLINVIPVSVAGNKIDDPLMTRLYTCMKCGECAEEIGVARIENQLVTSKVGDITIDVKVDITELDKALEKVERLHRLIRDE